MSKVEFTRPYKAWDIGSTSVSQNLKDELAKCTSATFHCQERAGSGLPVKVNAFVVEAMYRMLEGKIAVVQVGSGSYAAEEEDKTTKRTVVVYFNINGMFQMAVVKSNGNHGENPVIGAAEDKFDHTPFYACFLPALAEAHPTAKTIMDAIVDDYKKNGTLGSPASLAELSDFVDYCFDEGILNPKTVGGSIPQIEAEVLTAGTMNGDVLFGKPNLLLGNAKKVKKTRKKRMTFKEAKDEFEAFANSHTWTEEEKMLIPSFPDDYIVLPEVITIARRFVNSRDFKRPMVNAMWRADTSYGKSTGVEMLAAILGLPLLRLTCHSTMEKTEFLTQFVPVTGKEVDEEAASYDMPSFDEISFDPETAYEQITGVNNEDATPEMCLQAIARRSAVDPMFRLNAAKAAFDDAFSHYQIFVDDDGKVDEERTAERTDALLRAQEELTQAFEEAKNAPARMDNAPKFKLVESNFIKALQKGYLCEVQELSRIKDAGVLVGLNEYDRPGSVIPMVDGSFCTRHPEAFVVYTDNVGYASCRPIDPSVIRRMAFVIDSPDLSEQEIKSRVKYNTGFTETALLDVMYSVWAGVRDYCRKHEITDGTCSPTELEMWVATVMIDGIGDLKQTCQECIVSKCTSDPEEQSEIVSSVLNNLLK